MTGTDRPSVTVVVIAHRADVALAEAITSAVRQDYRPLEIVLYGNGSELPAPAGVPDDVGVRLGGSPDNLGVAGGRNAAAALATGDALLFLDDDAVLRRGSIAAAVDALQSGPDVGAVAFNVVDPSTGRPALWYGHPVDDRHSAERFDTSTFIGCGNLVRRSAFKALGGFWDGYFREMEEIDFSWRLVDTGRRVRFEPSAIVEHPDRSEPHFRHSVASNLLLVWRLLPPAAALRQTAFLLAVFVARGLTRHRVRDLAGGLLLAARLAPRARRERETLRRPTVAWLRTVHAHQGLGKRLRWSLRPARSQPSPAP